MAVLATLALAAQLGLMAMPAEAGTEPGPTPPSDLSAESTASASADPDAVSATVPPPVLPPPGPPVEIPVAPALPGPNAVPALDALSGALADPVAATGPASYQLCWESPAVAPRCRSALMAVPQDVDVSGDGAPDVRALLGAGSSTLITGAIHTHFPQAPTARIDIAAPPVRFDVSVTDPAKRGGLPGHVYFVYNLPEARRLSAGFDGRRASLANSARLDVALGATAAYGVDERLCAPPPDATRVLVTVKHAGAHSPSGLTFGLANLTDSTPQVAGELLLTRVPNDLVADGRFQSAEGRSTIAFDLATSSETGVDGRIALGQGAATETIELGVDPLPSPSTLRIVHDSATTGSIDVCVDSKAAIREATVRHHVVRDGQPRTVALHASTLPKDPRLVVTGIEPAADDLVVAYTASEPLGELFVAYLEGDSRAAPYDFTTVTAGPIPPSIDFTLGGILGGPLTLDYDATTELENVFVTHQEVRDEPNPDVTLLAQVEDLPRSVDLSVTGRKVTFDASEPLGDLIVIYQQNEGVLSSLPCCDQLSVDLNDRLTASKADDNIGVLARIHGLQAATIDPDTNPGTYKVVGTGGQPFAARVHIRDVTSTQHRPAVGDVAVVALIDALPETLTLAVDEFNDMYGYAASSRLGSLTMCLDRPSIIQPDRDLPFQMLTPAGCTNRSTEGSPGWRRVWLHATDLPSVLTVSARAGTYDYLGLDGEGKAARVTVDMRDEEKPIGATQMALRVVDPAKDGRVNLHLPAVARHVLFEFLEPDLDKGSELTLNMRASGWSDKRPNSGATIDGEFSDTSTSPSRLTDFDLSLDRLPEVATLTVFDNMQAQVRVDATTFWGDGTPGGASLDLYTGAPAALFDSEAVPQPASGVAVRDHQLPSGDRGTRIALAMPGLPSTFLLDLKERSWTACKFRDFPTVTPSATELYVRALGLRTNGPFEVDVALVGPEEQPELRTQLTPDDEPFDIELKAMVAPDLNFLCNSEGVEVDVDLTSSTTGRLYMSVASSRRLGPTGDSYWDPSIPARGVAELHAALPTRLDANIKLRSSTLSQNAFTLPDVNIEDDVATIDVDALAGLVCPDALPLETESSRHFIPVAPNVVPNAQECLQIRWGTQAAESVKLDGLVRLRDIPPALSLNYTRTIDGPATGDIVVDYNADAETLDAHLIMWKDQEGSKFDPLTLTAYDLSEILHANVDVLMNNGEGVGAKLDIEAAAKPNQPMHRTKLLRLTLRGSIITRNGTGYSPLGAPIRTQTRLELREPLVLSIEEIEDFHLETGTVMTITGRFDEFSIRLPYRGPKRCVVNAFQNIDHSWDFCLNHAPDDGYRYNQRLGSDEPFVMCALVTLADGPGQADLCVTTLTFYAAADHENEWGGRPHTHYPEQPSVNNVTVTPHAGGTRWFLAVNPDDFADETYYASPGDPHFDCRGPEGGIWIYNPPAEPPYPHWPTGPPAVCN